jgi:ubiquinone/menaquinone biosynthesis C-methylase UbiE
MFDGWIYFDDFVEFYIKLQQRGWSFVKSKINFSSHQRTISAFDAAFDHANWWVIPEVKLRNNYLISGNKDINYEAYVSQKFITSSMYNLVSIGCGTGNHEIAFAELNPHLNIIGYDISPSVIDEANRNSLAKGLKNIKFICMDISNISFEKDTVDIFLFNSSLHHFNNLDLLIKEKLSRSLRHSGLLIINEYVGPDRLHLDESIYNHADNILNKIPEKLRRIYKTTITKTHTYRSGKARMIIADPSECVESSKILPLIHENFDIVEERNIGGLILMLVMKHIAHHFVGQHHEILATIMDEDLHFSNMNQPSFLFGVYRKQ